MPALKTIKAGNSGNVFIPKNIREVEKAKEDKIRMENGKPPLRRVNTNQVVVPQKGRAERLVSVDIKDILPYEEEEPEALRRQKKLAEEVDSGFSKALNRWEKTIITPQKEIIANTILDSQVNNENISAGDLLEKLNKFGEDMSNKEIKIGNKYNKFKAESIANERSRKRRMELKEYGHYLEEDDPDFMNGDRMPWENEENSITGDQSSKIATMSIEDFLEDSTPSVGNNNSGPNAHDLNIKPQPMTRPISSDIEF